MVTLDFFLLDDSSFSFSFLFFLCFLFFELKVNLLGYWLSYEYSNVTYEELSPLSTSLPPLMALYSLIAENSGFECGLMADCLQNELNLREESYDKRAYANS